ncbi:MAG: 23S rRNA (adenine(1618)-N(6))-methyltransferase RlmF [Flavobacteriaceae bacterium]|nr:23S rRNA (adenine(1618)-N(6))-methyltransferase RlmF [Flavobacteriaceae bacterium]
MHPNNIHSAPYDFQALVESHPPLKEFVFKNNFGTETIDFSKSDAVFHLNKALLKHHYGIEEWSIPEGYLCPPIPSRADYIHHIEQLLSETLVSENNNNSIVKGLDIGMGANCIYPILGAQIYGWEMLGVDINEQSVISAQANVNSTKSLQNKVEIKHQTSNAQIFEGIINEGDYYQFTMCNPPFHTSAEAATKGTLRKLKNLEENNQSKKEITLNFGGQANELWCNGGEALFIKRMIKQSVAVKDQVGWFTTLVSKKEHLNKFYKQLDKLQATHKTILMSQGNKRSRILIWQF